MHHSILKRKNSNEKNVTPQTARTIGEELELETKRVLREFQKKKKTEEEERKADEENKSDESDKTS